MKTTKSTRRNGDGTYTQTKAFTRRDGSGFATSRTYKVGIPFDRQVRSSSTTWGKPNKK